MKQLYADVIVDISIDKLDKTFQYRIPEELADRVQEGSKVRVPFGNGDRIVDGFVVSTGSIPKIDTDRIKDIEDCPENYITAEEKLVRLAAWIKRTYGSTFVQALKTVLPVKEKTKVKEKRIICSEMDIDSLKKEKEICEKKHFTARERIISALIEKKSFSWEYAVKELKGTQPVLKTLLEKKIISISKSADYRKTLPSGIEADNAKQAMHELNEQQKKVYESIKEEFNSEKPRPCLIRGVTGSGKTYIYMRLIKDVIDSGKQAILLIPEISLTWQTVSRFYACFGDRTAVLHSKLSKGERSDLIERVKNGEVSLVIGPRSALFTPFENLGIIIIDEEHDPSYQSEKAPRYHARETAVYRAEMENANVVLGSATPAISSRYRCETGDYALFELDNRFAGASVPFVKVVDMRKELEKGRKSVLSEELENAMAQRLEKKEQIMLFLNRRGHTGFISCRSCGSVIKCPHCDVSLTLHNNHMLICHYCGYSQPMVKNCPKCGSKYIGGFKIGTQQLEEVLQKRFPDARILRMDRDTVGAKESYEKILSGFSKGEADILVGTQMIVKGHDFPNVTLVGVVAADTALYAQNYSAAEGAFQLLVQAIGRAGRGKTRGTGIIQTYNPDHYAIEAAKTQDYEAFYQEEIANRRIMMYPPISCLLSIHGSAKEDDHLQNAMNYIKKYLEKIRIKPQIQILGPVYESVAKVQDLYRMVIYIKNADISDIIKMRQYTEKYIAINSGFNDINIQFSLNN